MIKRFFLLVLCVVTNLSADHGTLKGRCGRHDRRNSTSDIPIVAPKPTHARTQSATLPTPLPAQQPEPSPAQVETKPIEALQPLPEPFVPREHEVRVEGNERPINPILKASLVTICSAAAVGVAYQLVTAAPQAVIRVRTAAEVKKVTHKS